VQRPCSETVRTDGQRMQEETSAVAFTEEAVQTNLLQDRKSQTEK
jgi:hypothetical protein